MTSLSMGRKTQPTKPTNIENESEHGENSKIREFLPNLESLLLNQNTVVLHERKYILSIHAIVITLWK